MFRGEHYQTIDPKGRIILPAKFRSELFANFDTNLVVVKHPDKHLMGFPFESWIPKEEELKKAQTGSLAVRRMKRFFISSASECTVDRQGRIVIPPSLKLFAGLGKDVVIVGAIDHFEFWNRERYDEFMDQEIGESEELQEMHNRLGF